MILGKLGLSEYANSFGNQPSGFANLTGQVIHGLDADQNPSGSSSGSGTAGTAALSMLIVGTETGGSIISPSQAQSLVGLRPTVGLVPGYGVAPIRLSADTAGPMDRTVANAALTLQSIAGKDPINDAYYTEYWGPGINPSDVVPPQPPTVPDYTSALDLDFVRGKRIGWNGTSDQVNQAKAALEAAGAILVERPVIDPPANLPALATQGEQHMAIDMYYKRLGPSAPIKSLGEEIADNQANQHEALKFGNNSHLNAFNVPYGPGTDYTALFNANLPIRKAGLQGAINRMMTNDTPADTSDDFIAILGTVPSGAAAGFPQLTIPMGYNATHRRTQFVSVHGNAYSERNLIGVAYVIEQATKLRQPASMLNPSMYRCAKTIPAPPFASRGGCNPDYPSTMAMVGGAAPELPFTLELESVTSLQERMTAGTLTAETLVKAYLVRIARTNAEGPAIQAVRALESERRERGQGARRRARVRRPRTAARHPGARRRFHRRERAADHGGLDRAAEVDAGRRRGARRQAQGCGRDRSRQDQRVRTRWPVRRQHARGLLVARRPGAAALGHRQDRRGLRRPAAPPRPRRASPR